jgi:hypothetical protein
MTRSAVRTAGALTLAVVVLLCSSPAGARQGELAAAASAMGGASQLAAIKSFRLKGSKLIRNQFYGKAPGASEEFLSSPLEIKAEFPARYLQSVDLVIGQRTRRFESGFDGPRLLNRTIGIESSMPSSPNALATQRLEFARLALLLLLRTDTAAPLTVRKAASPKGEVHWTMPDGEAVAMVFDPLSALPLRLVYQVTLRNSDGSSSSERRETSLEVLDRRPVDGIRVPSRLRLLQGGEVMEQISFDSVELNPILSPRDFGGFE